VSPRRRDNDRGEPARRGPSRIGDLLPVAARSLGLEEELRWARAAAAWNAVLAALAPGAGQSRLVRLAADGTLVVDAELPIAGQEIRLRADELLAAFEATPGGFRAARLRVVVAPHKIGPP
jgi:hypothetical protein